MKVSFACAAGTALLMGSAPALAGEVAAGAFQHGAQLHIAAGDEEKGADAMLQYRSAPLDTEILFGRPMVYGLVSKNLAGDTSFASAGLMWRSDIGRRLYGQMGFGLAAHDGAVDRADTGGDNAKIVFGSRVLFQSELGLGLRLSERWSFEATYVHISNAHIWTDVNPGMDDVGGRLVVKF